MENYEEAGVDPDYISYNSAVELNEEEDKKENLAKIRKIIDDEYSREIVQRHNQIEQIELQICKVRKVLHLLRYVLVMSYYKKKELEYNGADEEGSNSDAFIAPDKQNRIHPAVKKLLGKSIHSVDHVTINDKRKSSSRTSSILPQPHLLSPKSKKIKLDVPDLVQCKSDRLRNHDKSLQLELIKNRKKTKYRIVVGNISKWMPSSEEDALTHKWMVYVRGPKEAPDVSHFIHKVVYYLHPSYKPHDVVEVSESPFHLSRRGWGEFPVRVQIFFKVTLNKPIDVIHNIKLDKTYSGRQMLGNETVVDVFLYDKHSQQPLKIKDEDVEMTEEATSSLEHDYCSNQASSSDHTYCLRDETQPKIKSETIEQDIHNQLIYGLESYFSDSFDDRPKTVIPANHLLQLNRKDIKFSNTKIIVFGRKIDGCILTNMSNASPPKNSHKIVLPQDRFKNMGEALCYLFKRLPLYTELANNSNYKRLYPFTAPTLKEYTSWNIGKRRSAEWSRARTIKNLLVTSKVHGVQSWTTKAILMFGRSHQFTPSVSYGLFVRDSNEKNLILSCYADSTLKSKSTYLRTTKQSEEPEVIVNVESDTDVTTRNHRTVIDIADSRIKHECSYIKQTALDCGIVLKPEEIEDGVKLNGAELMILEAVKCLAENLIRRAKNHRVCTQLVSSSSDAIRREDVEMAIIERPEIRLALRQFKHKKQNFDYFS